ncbi:hypothetical protein GPECTOR_1g653 [Gonium pectorale]|uniref:RING-type domain-containing protein n=1 Tax=Gonium pectorale TaxID=33097 RepID=A0A150H3W7_GONPE|nr:hypothetical protein GPECTOR_1g653 [Gonium pectorale]|eukprot:KXZ56725.1 hypothetical protein GPECTOR_1g653 [Gonium pectorale]
MSPFLAIILLYGIMLLMVGAQTALFLWKKRHRQSYELVTLIGLWVMPAIFSVHLHFWRFLIIWAAFSAITGRLLWACARKKMARTTPRQVYTFFLGVYKASKVVGVTGYCMVLAELFGMGPLLHLLLPRDFAIDLVWYGLYFGILGRDCAQVASDSLSSRLGMEGRQLVTRINNCGICGNELRDELVPVSGTGEGEEQAPAERTVQLSCKHCFHDLCVRGWTLVGKKMMDGIRYLVVWNPIIFTVLSLLLHLFGPHRRGDSGPPVPLSPGMPLGAVGASPGAGVVRALGEANATRNAMGPPPR